MLWDPGVRGEVVSAVAGVVRHTPPWVGRMASTPLTAEVKNALRAEAREIWQNVSGRRAIWDKLEVHHRIPWSGHISFWAIPTALLTWSI